jgi:DNA primase
MINLEELKLRVDLLALVGEHTTLKRVANSGGGEWAGPCPFCGGRDRFRVQPYAPGGGRWLCRSCTDGRWQDVIHFGERLWPGMAFQEVCAQLGEDPAFQGRQASSQAHPNPAGPGQQAGSRQAVAVEDEAYQAPNEDWQARAQQALTICARYLWENGGRVGLDYLYGRGLQDETLRYWQVGFSSGAHFGELWVPRGVLLPCVVRGEVWYLKVALLPGEPVRCQGCRKTVPARQPCRFCGTVNKYRGVTGNRTAAIFGADELVGAWGALFVEGEFDALAAWQELRDVIAVCTLGSATNQPDLATWGPYLLGLETILAAYDRDEAGQRGAAVLGKLSEKVLPVDLPAAAKDLNEYLLSGGKLWPWLRGELIRLGLVEEED